MDQSQSGPSSSTVVLVVEDNHLILMSALDLVATAGYESVGAESADEAIAILEARSDVKLVFTDIEMPGTIDGAKLAHYIRNRWPPIHLIVASGKEIKDESQLPTGSTFFAKPYDNDTILAEMARMLRAIDAGKLEMKV
ncbi:MAG: response regulator [Rhodospirillales bacterium]|nr:response regulator [Rhodospirillales bacterium]